MRLNPRRSLVLADATGALGLLETAAQAGLTASHCEPRL
jgi:hypothetical protein